MFSQHRERLRAARLYRAAAMVLTATALIGQGPPPPPPASSPRAAGASGSSQNPITEGKRVLGKILFSTSSCSSDDTVACGSCHRPQVGGIDPRLATHPGIDGVLGTPDDHRGSIGVVRSDASNDYLPDAVFGLNAQITKRHANSLAEAAYAAELFWDGRAPSTFVDPDAGLPGDLRGRRP